MSINFDGTVSSCCLDYKHESLIGDANIHTIKDIWNGYKMRNLRHLIDSNQLSDTPICNGCSALEEQSSITSTSPLRCR